MIEFIFDNLEPILFTVVVAFALVRKILEGINAKKAEGGGTPTLEDLFGPDTEEEDPGDFPRRHAAPPPLPTTDPATPPPLHRVNVRALASEADTELARQQAIQERIRKIREAKQKTLAASQAIAPPMELIQRRSSSSRPYRLSTRRDLRQAFIAKEILDRPLSLR